METYISTIIKTGGILVGSAMILFVIWHIAKEIADLSGNDPSDGK